MVFFLFFFLMQHWQFFDLSAIIRRKHTRKTTFLRRQLCESKCQNVSTVMPQAGSGSFRWGRGGAQDPALGGYNLPRGISHFGLGCGTALTCHGCRGISSCLVLPSSSRGSCHHWSPTQSSWAAWLCSPATSAAAGSDCRGTRASPRHVA